ncbi:MAG: lytic murein transglycosylase B [Legionellales bacterium]|nr:lytic murein transglycosylase B [Legionellales bacterium]
MRRAIITTFIICMFTIISTSYATTSKTSSNATKENTVNQQNMQFSQRQDVQKFINLMVKKHQFKKENLEQIFNKVHIQQSILKTMSKPAETWSWYKYQKFFLTTSRIQGGITFWNNHAKTLADIEKKDGVPASVIVAIIGVETAYGQNQGSYRVLDSLSTLAFEYPKRKKFFQSELEAYLLLARDNQFDVTSMLGSYAGAIGQGQFMPSSYRHYAVNYNGKGQTDLRSDTDDVIASIGNYLEKHGWARNKIIASKAQVTGSRYKKLTKNQLKPQYSVAFLKKHGVVPIISVPSTAKSNFMVLEGKNTPQYWLGFHNFYVISRYNPRINYAMAVYQLSEAIKKARTLSNH